MPFTWEEISSFWLEFKLKFRSGVRSPTGLPYTVFTFAGVAWASYVIPNINHSDISPETYGIYVIGFLVSVMLDAMIIWKKTKDDNTYEQAIAIFVMVISFLLIILSSFLSVKTFNVELGPQGGGKWKCAAKYFLTIILVCAIAMSLVLTGFDTKPLSVGSLDETLDAIRDR
jgi:heme/copper-type cytochrome/quinol oxidase subunit 4